MWCKYCKSYMFYEHETYKISTFERRKYYKCNNCMTILIEKIDMFDEITEEWHHGIDDNVIKYYYYN